MSFLSLISYFAKKLKYAGNISYSQNGEDLTLDRLFDSEKKLGFYVDIGAHHPTRFSNTYIFYLKGWHGINIDAQPGSMDLFNKTRPRDKNIEVGVGTSKEKMLFYQFNESALNTFNIVEADQKVSDKYFRNEGTEIQMKRLDDILKEHLPHGKKIDFISIDVEGNEFDVLMSNDWDLFRPKYLLLEILRSDLKGILNNSAAKYLETVGYFPISKIFDTVIFEERDI